MTNKLEKKEKSQYSLHLYIELNRVWCLEDGRGDPPDEGDGAGEVIPHEVDEGSVHLEELLPEDPDLLLLLALAQPGGATLHYLQTHPANVRDCNFTPSIARKPDRLILISFWPK